MFRQAEAPVSVRRGFVGGGRRSPPKAGVLPGRNMFRPRFHNFGTPGWFQRLSGIGGPVFASIITPNSMPPIFVPYLCRCRMYTSQRGLGGGNWLMAAGNLIELDRPSGSVSHTAVDRQRHISSAIPMWCYSPLLSLQKPMPATYQQPRQELFTRIWLKPASDALTRSRSAQ